MEIEEHLRKGFLVTRLVSDGVWEQCTLSFLGNKPGLTLACTPAESVEQSILSIPLERVTAIEEVGNQGLSISSSELNLVVEFSELGQRSLFQSVLCEAEFQEGDFHENHVLHTVSCSVELACDDLSLLYWNEGLLKIEPITSKCLQRHVLAAWKCWCSTIHELNQQRMETDKYQWLLHARTHEHRDLQAWYHACFSDELYRLKGPFWYKEAALQEYQFHTISQPRSSDTPQSVLGTSDVTYATMAATMYTIREILSFEENTLFDSLTSTGVNILKHPRRGTAQSKLFQLSLVQGDMYLYMYLTWKGKQGTQGVELASVSVLEVGIGTDILRKRGKREKSACYLSLVLPDRSLDLEFRTIREQTVFHACMSKLVRMEQAVRAAEKSDQGNDGTPPVLL